MCGGENVKYLRKILIIIADLEQLSADVLYGVAEATRTLAEEEKTK